MAKFSVPETNDSPDLTPMIDVVFLLIVFMVVAQRLSEQYIELSGLPIAANSSVKGTPSRTIISIDETPEGQKFYWGEQEIDISQISVAVREIQNGKYSFECIQSYPFCSSGYIEGNWKWRTSGCNLCHI